MSTEQASRGPLQKLTPAVGLGILFVAPFAAYLGVVVGAHAGGGWGAQAAGRIGASLGFFVGLMTVFGSVLALGALAGATLGRGVRKLSRFHSEERTGARLVPTLVVLIATIAWWAFLANLKILPFEKIMISTLAVAAALGFWGLAALALRRSRRGPAR